MSGRTISSYTTTGVNLTSYGSPIVSITSTGVINANASYSAAVYGALGVTGTVLNSGTLMAASGTGVLLKSGGTVVNGGSANDKALISVSQYGIRTAFGGLGSVVNYGTIITTDTSATSTGISLFGGGSATNGSVGDVNAYIHCYQSGIVSLGPNSTIANYGTIVVTGTNNSSYGVYLRAGGTFTNGSNSDKAATILTRSDGASAAIYQSTIANYGTIVCTTLGKADVILLESGKVINGSSTDTSAYLESASAGRSIYIVGPVASTVVNYGTVAGGVSLRPGGTIVNGSNADTQARIAAANYGVSLVGPIASVVQNFGTITSNGKRAVILGGGGTVTNGSASDLSAYIAGTTGIYASGTNPAYLTNFGTIAASSTSTTGNIVFMSGGTVVNGSSADTTAAILRSTNGIRIVNGPGRVANYGMIGGSLPVSFYRSGGHTGVTMTAVGTVINAGTIQSSSGTSGTAIQFGSGAERLVVDPGSVIVGRVIGGTGSNTLELAAGGHGTLSGLGSVFVNFNTVMVDAGSIWTLSGTNSVASGSTLTEAGSMSVSGVFVNSGSVAGQMMLAAGATLANYGTVGTGGTSAIFAGGGLLQVGSGAAFSGRLVGAGLTGLELLANSTGSVNGFNGTSGTISTGGNSWSVSGMGGTMTVDRTANWTFGAGTTLGNGNAVNVFGTANAAGYLTLGSAGTVLISGPTARLFATTSLVLHGATLSEVGGGVAEVGAGGTSVGSQTVIDGGKTLSGYGTIAAPVTDSGTLLAQGGTLAVTGRVTGTGTVNVAANSTLRSQTGLNESKLVFGGANATVQVAKSTAIAATISGIGSTDTIDFMGTVATTLSFSGGRLKVIGAAGTIASLGFAGSYSSGNFKLTSDGAGGTDLTTVGLAAANSGGVRAFAWSGASALDLRSGMHAGVMLVGPSYPGGGAHSATGTTIQHANWSLLHQA